MSVPVAGRRRGMGAAPSPQQSSPPATVFSDGVPSWLDDDANTTPSGLGGVPGHGRSQAHAGLASASPPVPANTLPASTNDFLSFLGSSNDNNLQSRAANLAAEPPLSLLPTRGSHSLPSQAVPQPSSPQLPWDDDATPAFLLGDAVNTTAASARPSPPTAVSVGKRHGSGEDDALRQQWKSLKAELKRLNREHAQSLKVVESLENGEHELCEEVRGVQSEYKALEAKYAEAQASKKAAEKSAVATQTAQQEEERMSAAVATRNLREEMEALHKAALQSCQDELEKQEEAVSAARAALEEMQQAVGTTTAGAHQHSGAIDRLQSSLATMISGVRRELLLSVKPILARSIQEEMGAAAEQRQDIFAADAETRGAALERFRQQSEDARVAFAKEYKEAMHAKRDAMFGALKQHMQTTRDAHMVQMQQRLSDYRAQVVKSVQTVRDSTETNITQLVDSATRTREEMATRFTREVVEAQARGVAQVRRFRERAAAEMRSLQASAQARRHSTTAGLPCAPESDNSALSEVREDLDGMRRRLDQIRFLAQSETTALTQRREHQGSLYHRQPQTSEGARLTADPEETVRVSAHELTAALHRLQHLTTASREMAQRMKKTLQEKRVRLAALHDAAETTRQRWETDIRGTLSGVFLGHGSGSAYDDELRTYAAVGGPDIPLKESLAADVVESLSSSLCAVRSRQQAISAARFDLYEALRDKAAQLGRQRGASDTALHAVFNAYEKLHSTASTLEGLQHVMELASADARATRTHLDQQHAELAAQQERLASLAARLQKESKRLRKAEDRLQKREAQQCAEETRLQTMLSLVPRNTTALMDVSMNTQPPSASNQTRPHRKPLTPSAQEHDRPMSSASPSPVIPTLTADAHDWPLASLQNEQPMPAQRHPKSGLHRPLAPPHGGQILSNSPHSTLHTASEFSTDLVPLDDESIDDMAALQAALGLDSTFFAAPSVMSVTQPQLPTPSFPVSFTAEGSALPPQAETTRFGRSLTTPSSSHEG